MALSVRNRRCFIALAAPIATLGAALVAPGADPLVVEGEVRGSIAAAPKGRLGFGYDPIFVPHGSFKTFAEIEPAQKHAISHRAQAFAKLLAALS